MSYQPQPGTIPFRAIAWLQAQGPDAEVRIAPWAEAIDVDVQTMVNSIEAALKHGLVLKFAKLGTLRPAYYKLPDGPRAAPERDKPMGSPAPTYSEVVALARNGNGSALPSEVVAQLSKPTRRAIANDGVDIDRVNRVAESVPNDAPLHIPTFRSAAAAPRSAYRDTPREGRDVLKAGSHDPSYVDSPAESEAPTHSTALNGTAETPAPGQRETASMGSDFRCARWDDGSMLLTKGEQVMQLTPAEARRLTALCGVLA